MNEEQKKEALTCKWQSDVMGWRIPPCIPDPECEAFPPAQVDNWLFCPFCGASIELKEEA